MTKLDAQHVSQKNHMAIFALLFSAASWGVMWFPYRLLNYAGISGVPASFYSYALAFLLASVYFAKKWRGIFNLQWNILGLCLCAGWTNIAYVLAVLDGEIMRVMLLFYLSPIWTLILAHFWLKERTNRRGIMVIMLAIIGAFIMLYDPTKHTANWISRLPIPQNQAEWIALSAGICFALSNVITRKSTHLSLVTKSFAVWLGVLLTTIIILPFVQVSLPWPSAFTLSNWLILLLIAILLISATMFVQYGVTKISAMRASVLLLFELVVAAIASYYLANEVMRWNEWLGGALIMLATIIPVEQAQKSH